MWNLFEQDVVRFDISVNDALLVKVNKSVKNLRKNKSMQKWKNYKPVFMCKIKLGVEGPAPPLHTHTTHTHTYTHTHTTHTHTHTHTPHTHTCHTHTHTKKPFPAFLRLEKKSVCGVDINSEVYLYSQPENQNVLYSRHFSRKSLDSYQNGS